MLADPEVEAVVVATSDAWHVRPAAIKALEAGKAVLCEKPIGTAVEEVEELRAVVARSGKVLQVGHLKRFDPGLEAAKAFVDGEMGQTLAAEGLVLRLDPPLHHDGCRPAVAGHEHPPAQARRQPEGRPPPLQHAGPWQPPSSTPPASSAARSPKCGRGSPRGSEPIAGSSKRGSPMAPWDTSISRSRSGWIGSKASNSTASMAASWPRLTIPGIIRRAMSRSSNESDATTRRVLGGRRALLPPAARRLRGDGSRRGPAARRDGSRTGLASVRAMAAIAESVRTGQTVSVADMKGPV